MVIIGVDPHKRLHMASVVEPATNRRIAALQVEASLAGYRRLWKWAGGFGERRWAVENARGLGRHLAQWLVARGELVDDVPSTATARVRELSRGGRRKNDVIDAAAAASVAALQGEANPVLAEDLTTVLGLLDERRSNLSTQRTRLVNQLHALLRELVPGGAPTDLTATIASQILTGVRPAGPVEAARKQLARDLVAEIRDADQRLKALTAQIADTLAATGSRLTEVSGVPMAGHNPRRSQPSSGPGRTPGGDTAIQRGWLNPSHQHFGKVTSRTRHPRLYDQSHGGLTNTEEPPSGSCKSDFTLRCPSGLSARG
jgi:transposase